jgi:hypothetical protein
VRTIPDPGFAGDDGSAAPAVQAALDEVAAGAPLHVAVAALCEARLLVPVVAVPSGSPAPDPSGSPPRVPAPPDDPSGDAGPAGAALGEDKSTDMAAVLMTGRDGRQALLAFSSLDSLRAWDPKARPVPVTMSHAAQAALSEGAAALVVDVVGPVQVPIEGPALRRLADGQRLVRVDDGFAWALPT